MTVTSLGKLVSSQSWKLWLGFGFLAIAGVFLFVPFQRSVVVGGIAWPRELLGTLIALAAFFWMAIAVVCSQCRLRLFWYAISAKPASNWLGWLFDVNSCPRCGYEPRSHTQDGIDNSK